MATQLLVLLAHARAASVAGDASTVGKEAIHIAAKELESRLEVSDASIAGHKTTPQPARTRRAREHEPLENCFCWWIIGVAFEDAPEWF